MKTRNITYQTVHESRLMMHSTPYMIVHCKDWSVGHHNSVVRQTDGHFNTDYSPYKNQLTETKSDKNSAIHRK